VLDDLPANRRLARASNSPASARAGKSEVAYCHATPSHFPQRRRNGRDAGVRWHSRASDFLAGFPSVTKEQVIQFFEQAKDHLVAAAS